ncbi:MAG: hypothetical protein IJI36_18225 [Kiritimatiellae bacterium]|nr:hypothetical protein [Kiritimatiellia bacterium]
MSSDIVGYQGITVTAGKLHCVGLQFGDVGADGELSISSLATSNISAGLWESMSTDAPCIMIYNGSSYDYYYYISDAGENYDETGWADGDGNIVTATEPVGSGLWLRIPEGMAENGKITEAGKVESADTVTLTISQGLTLGSNPYPMSLDMSKVTTVGLAPGLWETMSTDAPCLMIYNGSSYDYYYYISDAGENYDETGWADGDGNLVTTVASAGEAFWLRTSSTGTLTFSK